MFEFKPKIDFLTMRIKKDKIHKTFYWICINSPVVFLDSIIWLDFKIEYDEYKWTHTFYNLYDLKNNKLAQICITDISNKKSDVYDKITFYWTFFNLYWLEYIYQIFDYFYLDYETSVFTRLDLCMDFNEYKVSDFKYKIEYLEKVKTFWTTWKSLEMNKEYKFRVYNKLLDILDKWLYKIEDNNGYSKYNDLLQGFELLTRLELQLNSRIIKDKLLTIKDVFDNEKMSKIFRNYYIQVFQTNLKKTRFEKIEKEKDLYTYQKYLDKIEHSKIMTSAYIKKLYLLEPNTFQKTLYWILDWLYKEDIAFNYDDYIYEFKRKQKLKRNKNKK